MGEGGDDGMPPRSPPDLYGGNTPQENSRRIVNEEKFQNRILRDRESLGELLNLEQVV